MFSWFASNDLKQYRAGYPDQTDDNSINSNLQFYRNEISSSPQGEYIDEIHEKWYQNYELLENHHGYIQWLFPIRERGLNPHAYPLQKHEIEKMKQEEEIQDRITKSYCLMLDFYGNFFFIVLIITSNDFVISIGRLTIIFELLVF
eukprot:gb/GECH01008106.1/.p1 GENE.gb/GECH01008106.1/~~gb/GECH01008106.1/.p1  ORF type:complete len:146 (+),score=23.51 gb/GECH01008106.1/:1-438(+)